MKAGTLKIPYAARNGRLVHISEVENGLQPDCTCPACKRPLVARIAAIDHALPMSPVRSTTTLTIIEAAASKTRQEG